MAYRNASTDQLITRIERSNSSTSHPTLDTRSHPNTPRRVKKLSCSLKYVFLTSKTSIFILLWTIVVGCIYLSAFYAIPLVVPKLVSTKHAFFISILAYACLALIKVLYPLGGLLGDVCFGRFRTVIISLVFLLVCLITASVDAGFLIKGYIDHVNILKDTVAWAIFITFASISVLFLVSGFSVFNSNVIQLGLDQLMDEPSESLGIFVHWFVWCYRLGQLFIQLLYAARQCTLANPIFGSGFLMYAVYCLPALFSLLLICFLILSCCAYKHFNRDRVHYNPYKMIYRVLNFARKNKYPIGHRTAFAYCDNVIPSRMDFAKQRYGGPFTTSDVEDVKTFVRVFVVLLALSPVFVLEFPSSDMMFATFALHSGQDNSFNNVTCEGKWMLLESGTLSSLTVVVILPVYMWIVYSVHRNRVPKILLRLGFAVGLYVFAVVSMLLVDLLGHVILYAEKKPNAMCMYVEHIAERETFDVLDLHWAVLILPNVLKRLAPDLIVATAFEFISAQSPHTMKGVLVGVFLGVTGVFQMFGAILLTPFAIGKIWRNGYLGEHPSVTSCGFGYYLVTIAVALIGFLLFYIAAKKYKYRKRDEEPFPQSVIEDIFIRRIDENCQRDRSRSSTRGGLISVNNNNSFLSGNYSSFERYFEKYTEPKET